jgi:hypothetical protein
MKHHNEFVRQNPDLDRSVTVIEGLDEQEQKQVLTINKEIYVAIALNCIIVNITNAFSPVFTKYLEVNYGLTLDKAGHLSSIPYIQSSIFALFFAAILKQSFYMPFMISGMLLIAAAHATFLEMIGNTVPNTSAVLVPILLVGFGATLMNVVQKPVMNHLII